MATTVQVFGDLQPSDLLFLGDAALRTLKFQLSRLVLVLFSVLSLVGC